MKRCSTFAAVVVLIAATSQPAIAAVTGWLYDTENGFFQDVTVSGTSFSFGGAYLTSASGWDGFAMSSPTSGWLYDSENGFFQSVTVSGTSFSFGGAYLTSASGWDGFAMTSPTSGWLYDTENGFFQDVTISGTSFSFGGAYLTSASGWDGFGLYSSSDGSDPVAEPGTLILFVCGIFGLVVGARSRRRVVQP